MKEIMAEQPIEEICPDSTATIALLPEPKGHPEITDELFSGLKSKPNRMATFGIYGDQKE